MLNILPCPIDATTCVPGTVRIAAMSVCSIFYNVERAFCVGSLCGISGGGSSTTTESISANLKDVDLTSYTTAPKDITISQRETSPTTHAPPWKFWRRLSSKRHNSSNKKDGDRVEFSDSLLAGQSDGRSRRECILKEADDGVSNEEDDLLEDLPDVLDKNALRGSQSLKPPPKPPRLFLMRSSSINNHRNTQTLTSSRNSFVMSSNNRHSKDEEFIKFPINIENGRFLTEATQNGSLYCIKNSGSEAVDKVEPDLTSKTAYDGKGIKYSANGNPMRIKMDLVASGQTHRNRDKITKHTLILHCLSELLCQRLKPTGLIEEMYRTQVITSGDLQAFRGHPDHRLVCESLITTVSRGDDQQYAAFCQVLRNTDKYRDVSEMLDAMTKISFMISEIHAVDEDENNILAEEKTIKFDVGFYDEEAHLLKPVVELDRIKTMNGKRGLGLRASGSHSSQISNASTTDGSLGKNNDHEQDKSLLVPMMTVSILGHNLKGDRTKVLADVLHTYNCILELCLGKTQLTSSDIGILSIPLQKNNSLTVLDVRLNPIGNEGASMLGNALEQNNTLRQLNLSSTGMDGAGCKRICDALKFNTALRELDISFVDLGDDGCVHIGEMLQQNKTLKKLRLRSSCITWAGCEFLFTALTNNTSLTDIDLSRNFIGNEGADIVALHLAKESYLRELNLENCGLTALGCNQLSQALIKNIRLDNLDLSNNFIGDTGARKLSEAIEENTCLRCIGLNMCEITNDGFERILDALECNKSLHALKLCYNRLGRDTTSQTASSENLRYRVRIVTSSRPKLRLLLWGNTFEES